MSDPIVSIIPATLVPSGVRDDRQSALGQTFGEALAAIDMSTLSMVDPLTVDARLLPFMIREFGAQELIDADLPEHVQRRLLKDIWKLKLLTGYDAGVKLGLEQLGVRAQIEHWFEQDPIASANTHRITVEIDEALYPDKGGHFADEQIAAIWKMIRHTKRKSQETELRIGVGAEASLYSAAFANVTVLAEALAPEPIPPLSIVAASRAVVPTAHLIASA